MGGALYAQIKMEEENRLEFLSSEVESYASVPDTVAPVEQPWEQQEESNKDDVTELTGTMRGLAISDEEEGNGDHEQDDELRKDENSQCNLYRPAISSTTDSDEDSSNEAQEWRLTRVDSEDDAGVQIAISYSRRKL